MSSPAPLVIAIDGPSGTGKSSVSRAVADALGIGYLDTGAMYRALTWWCLERQVPLGDAAAVSTAMRELPLEMVTDPRTPGVRVAGQPIETQIRQARVTENVSAVATNLDVRAQMRDRQRELIAQTVRSRGGVVAEGRDITSVVAPDAPVRILMTASAQARMERRAGELAVAASATRRQIVDRDRVDSTVSNFTTAGDGVATIDTTSIGFEQSVQAVLQLVAEVTGRG